METKVLEIAGRYPSRRAALLPALYTIQREQGWLSPEAMEGVADLLGVPKATVKGVATFYAMFNTRPLGRHLIQLCTNVACMVMGAERLVDLLNERYGLLPNGTTEDGRFSLVIMECIGACGTAPAMLVDTDFHENLTEENIFEILQRYQ
jgi:NADH-quinone oxidoreductase E subunit